MNRYEAHVTDEWQTDTSVIQVRWNATNGNTQAIAYMAEDRDGMAALQWHHIDPNTMGREHLDPTPGLRLPHDVAIAMARAILTEAGKDADEVERLKALTETLADECRTAQTALHAAGLQAGDLERQVEALERLVEAKDAHLEREARVATLHVREYEQDVAEGDRAMSRIDHPSNSERASKVISDAFRSSPAGSPTATRAMDHEMEQARQRIMRGE